MDFEGRSFCSITRLSPATLKLTPQSVRLCDVGSALTNTCLLVLSQHMMITNDIKLLTFSKILEKATTAADADVKLYLQAVERYLYEWRGLKWETGLGSMQLLENSRDYTYVLRIAEALFCIYCQIRHIDPSDKTVGIPYLYWQELHRALVSANDSTDCIFTLPFSPDIHQQEIPLAKGW